MTVYTARVTGRDGDWWAVRIDGPDITGGLTQALRLDHVEREALDYVVVTAGLPASTIEITVVVEDFGAVRDLIARAAKIRAGREQLAKIDRWLQPETHRLVMELHRSGVPQVEIGDLVGIRQQRVGQIIKHFEGQDVRTADSN